MMTISIILIKEMPPNYYKKSRKMIYNLYRKGLTVKLKSNIKSNLTKKNKSTCGGFHIIIMAYVIAK
jgi:hypothetical protein